ncbi:chaperonin-like RbcX protein 2, chloroplastic [Andrographis paniculata]|uniref:chaperonin-like RbcX protein 2, chloroplastic n=1 Tax=Andrographis paniculata TaxID=175694 RepID=UPI0021E751F1|nr:chaperonin-like RbcX protein 2, chloroplastic [Andrographis paniculata]
MSPAAATAAAVSVVGSSLIDSRTCPCWCFDAVAGGGDCVQQRPPAGRKHVPRLSSSFLDPSSVKALSGGKNLRKQRKSRGCFVVVDELAGQYEDNFDDIKRQILDYFTYKAVRTVLHQLYEMNPTQYRWFYNYIASNELGYGKSFIRNLVKDKQDLAERVMVTRLHLYGKWVKKCDHAEMYERISEQNLELMRERLIETVIWPSDDSNTSVVG